ncbi:MAG: phosphate ABC transporter permease subunit PstC [Hyphomonas sp.]|uniref:phosphate ABC transporter permease subunit PstC n=1 Tax=Hyphomonas sp. TaxID=87 RepID=UPI0018299D32|nr:phosphate ABC transporter permease subunit PstC [Hyphomonas sp.]MBA3067168.1 phosphate ABC transporter permease subunit PstC [Hyphomonas sp.]MBU3921220.1 phosphate ABC transporter permease subunit PstC [Alphaproteobacteria bacterium]MBU4061222.1 phosphate ABC transporter permease subunit PstC [Alphaproteobacteria bacterium]MBU4165134.1 phosphate ABC transporter permease subunit PstC [Alphaproteobacteria bacterium]
MLQQLGQLPMGWLLIALIAVFGSAAFFLGRMRAEQLLETSTGRMHSRPNYHGYYVAMFTVVPVVLIAVAYAIFAEDLMRSQLTRELPSSFDRLSPAELQSYLESVRMAAGTAATSGADRVFQAITNRYLELRGVMNTATLALLGLLAAGGIFWSQRRLSQNFRARAVVENGMELVLFLCAGVAIATTAGIVVSLLYESLQFFQVVSVWDFLTGTRWNAQTNAEFGALPLFFGTFMIALIAMLVAAPIGLFSAIFLSEYASPKARGWIKPILEILAGIPTVVYGFFALLVVAPAIRQMAVWFNESVIQMGLASEPILAAQPTSALAAGLVMGIMVIPFVSSLSDDVINAVPQTLRDAAYALGATKSETVKQVVVPAALPGIIAALLLAVSRAIGETMIVVMAAGKSARISMDPTSDLTTITVQIVSLMTGETGFDDPKTLSAFALGLVLFIVTLIFNIVALRVVKKYREKYE